MRRPFTLGVAFLFVLVLLLSTVTYTVRFTERAVLTTFGKADETDIKETPGLKFKWPYPVQSVIKYDTRLRHVSAAKQQQQTADNRQIVVEAFAAWRVSDPLRFYRSFSNAGTRAADHYQAAEQIIRSSLGGALSAVSKFRMDELFTTAESGSKLAELDGLILQSMSTGEGARSALASYGIEPVYVGVSQVRLPESTIRGVFERMTADRDKIVRSIESQGEATANTIRSQAQAQAETIRSFALQRAEEIRVQGDREAAPVLAQLNEKPELAVFLANIDLLRNATGKRVTLVLDGSVPGVPLFGANALSRLAPGQLPPFLPPREWLEGSSTDRRGASGSGSVVDPGGR